MLVFDDPYAIFEPDRIDETGELRWRALGRARGIAVLLVAMLYGMTAEEK